jgi:hypothetical protein
MPFTFPLPQLPSFLLQIANLLLQQGKNVFGWDVEWEINWDTNQFKYSGKDLFFK